MAKRDPRTLNEKLHDKHGGLGSGPNDARQGGRPGTPKGSK